MRKATSKTKVSTKTDAPQRKPRKKLSHSFDAFTPSPNRKLSWHIVSNEDKFYDPYKQVAHSLIRDLLRNCPFAYFAVSLYTDYASSLMFSAKSESKAFNRDVLAWYANWKKSPEVSNRYDFDTFSKLLQNHKLIDGEVLAYYAGEGKIQLLESDFLQDPTGEPTVGDFYFWNRGIKIATKDGSVLGYNIRRDLRANFAQYNVTSGDDMYIPVSDAYLLAHTLYNNQYHGQSPLLRCSNLIHDMYKAFDFALNKAKLSQTVGLVTKTMGRIDKGNGYTNMPNGLMHWDAGISDEIDFITPSTPSSEFQDYMDKVGRNILATLRIPYGYYTGDDLNAMQVSNFIEAIQKEQRDSINILNRIIDRAITDTFPFDLESYQVPVENLLRDTGFVGVKYPDSYLFQNLNEIAKARELGFINDQHLSEKFGFSGTDSEGNNTNITEPTGKDNLMMNV